MGRHTDRGEPEDLPVITIVSTELPGIEAVLLMYDTTGVYPFEATYGFIFSLNGGKFDRQMKCEYLLCALFMLMGQSLVAQSVLKNKSEKELSLLLNEVVVTGTGTAHYLKDVPVQTEVIRGKALESYQGRSIEDILQGLMPSITFSAGDMGSNIQMNGLGNDYILILVNGRRMNGNIGGQNDLNMINTDNIERIEIIKGAASSLYGSDAIAGVINIITKKYKEKVSVSNTTRVGAHGDISQGNILAINGKRFSSSTNFQYKHTDGWRNTDEELDHHEIWKGTVTKTVNRSTNYTIGENLTYKANNRLDLSAEGSLYQRWNYRLTGPYKYYRYNQSYRNFDVAGGARYALKGQNYLKMDVSFGCYNYYYDYTQQENTDFYTPEGKRITRYPGEHILQSSQQRTLGQAKGVFLLGDSHTLNAGLEYQYDYLKSPHRIQEDVASAYTLATYVQDEWNMTDRLNVTFGVRLTGHKEFGLHLSPKISSMYKVGDCTFRLSYSMGFKTPTLKELYDNYITTIGGGKLKHYYGNRDLKPQKSHYVSAGIEYNVQKLRLMVNGYYNRIRNMIDLIKTETTPEDRLNEVQGSMKYENLSKARSFGCDMTMTYHIVRSFSIEGGYSYSNTKAQYTDDPDSKDYMRYLPIDGTAYHRATWKAEWDHAWCRYRLALSLFGRYQSLRHYISDGNASPHQLWRLNTRHSLTGTKRWKVDLHLGVDNIFDYVDRTPFGYHRSTTSPGRTFYVSCVLKYQNKSK